MQAGALAAILEGTRGRVAALRALRHALEAAARAAPAAPPWVDAFGSDGVAVVAEVKRRSPSAGAIAPDLDPCALGAAYAAGGARAISVLTEPQYFGGSVQDLEAVSRAVALPVLRKDFLIDPLQVLEARARGASAVLLIVRVLEGGLLAELSGAAVDVGMARLVEVHDAAELDRALALEPEAVGVNSRDLDTLAVDVTVVRDLVSAIPAGTIAVAESGLSGRGDVERVAQWGADGVLIGTALAAAADPAAAVRALVGVARRGRRR